MPQACFVIRFGRAYNWMPRTRANKHIGQHNKDNVRRDSLPQVMSSFTSLHLAFLCCGAACVDVDSVSEVRSLFVSDTLGSSFLLPQAFALAGSDVMECSVWCCRRHFRCLCQTLWGVPVLLPQVLAMFCSGSLGCAVRCCRRCFR